MTLLNAAGAILVADKASSWQDALELAAQTIDSGAARDILQRLIDVSN